MTSLGLRRSLTKLRSDDDGMTLVELMFALFILAVAVLSLAAIAGSTVRTVRLSRDRDEATAATSAALEAARGFAFDELALADNNVFTGDDLVSSGTFAHDDGQFEPLVLSTSGIDPYVCTPEAAASCWFEFTAYSTLDSVATYITWYDDDPTVDSDADGTADNDRDAKRVTAIATWTDGRTVRQSTIVAQASRGLGTPDFVIRPQSHGTATAPRPFREGEGFCLEHELENFGADDSYDFWMEGTDVTGITPATDNLSLKFQSGKRWVVRAWLGGAPDDPDGAWDEARTWQEAFNDDPSHIPSGDTHLMENTDGADAALESADTVAKDEIVQLAVCYQPGKNTEKPSPPEQYEVFPLFRSQLSVVLNETTGEPSSGQDGVVAVAHHFEVSSTVSSVFLDDHDELDDGTETEETPFSFDRNLPPDRTLLSYDATDYDTGIPGFGLLKPSNDPESSGQTLVWIDNDADVGEVEFDVAVLTIWTSWDEAIEFGNTQQRDMTFEVRVCATDSQGETCPTTGAGVVQKTYTHDVAGWVRHTIGGDGVVFDFDTAQAGQWLRLEFQCLSGSREDKDVDCHVAFDTQTFPAQLDVSLNS